MSNLILISNLGTKILRWIFFALDTAIYELAAVAYKVFDQLASAELLTDDIIKNVTGKVFAILGIVMVFVIAFNLLTYIIDPDKISDKKVGASSFIKDVIIALVVVTLLPTLFSKLYSLQSHVIKSGVISNLILGSASDTNSEAYKEFLQNNDGSATLGDYYSKNGANIMVANVFSAFFYPSGDFTSLDCKVPVESDYASNNAYKEAQTLYTEYKEYCTAFEKTKNTGKIQSFNKIYTKEKYNYSVLLSTAGGVAVLFFTLSFCLDMAKRAGKLAILQLLAPIPLFMEILPNKKGTRKNWFDTLIKVYLEVFLYQFSIYLVIFLISLIPDVISGIMQNAGFSLVKMFAMVFLIFGLLLFGKEAPKMVMDLLGIKGSGSIAAAFKRSGVMAGVAANTAASTIGNMSRGAAENKGWKRVGGALGSGASAFARNLWAGRNAHSWKDAKANRMAINQGISDRRLQRQADEALYGGWSGALKHNLSERYNSAATKFSSASGFDVTPNKYLTKQRSMDAYNQYKDLYKGISDIWNGNSEYQMWDNEYKKAEKSGNFELANKYKTARDECKTKLIQKNSDKIADVTRKINNFAATHQNISGFEGVHINEESVRHAAKKGEVYADLTKLQETIFGSDTKQMVQTGTETVHHESTSAVQEPVMVQARTESGKLKYQIKHDSNGNVVYQDKAVQEPVMVHERDDNGRLKYQDKKDQNGNTVYERVAVQEPVMEQARTESGKLKYKRVLNDEGIYVNEPVMVQARTESGELKFQDKLDSNGNVVYQDKAVQEPVMVHERDDNGRLKYQDKKDQNGNTVYEKVAVQEPVMEQARTESGKLKFQVKRDSDGNVVYETKHTVEEKPIFEEQSIHKAGAFDNINNDMKFRKQQNDLKNSQENVRAVKKAQAEKKEAK